MDTKWPTPGCDGQREDSGPRQTEQDGVRFHLATQNSLKLKTYELSISGIFHLIFSDCGWPRVTETMKSETDSKVGVRTIYKI